MKSREAVGRDAISSGGGLENLLSAQQLADILGVPRRTIEKWVYEKTGPASVKVGRHRRFRRADVERWLAERAS